MEKQKLIFNSALHTFYATEIDKNVIGCEGMFHLVSVKQNKAIGKVYGEEGEVMLAYTGETITANELRELADLITKIKNAVIAAQEE